ncbi:MAG: phage holin family protein [Muribaculaceae bacterium]|nr:phage holin family protein [Muribaculaceae bacterium]
MSDIDYKKAWEELQGYLKLQFSYGKLTAVEKLSILLSAIAVFAVLLIIGGFVLFNLATGIVLWLGDAIGIVWLAYVIVSVLLVLLMVLVFCMRKQWIVDPVTRFVTRLFLSPDEDEQKEAKQ